MVEGTDLAERDSRTGLNGGVERSVVEGDTQKEFVVRDPLLKDLLEELKEVMANQEVSSWNAPECETDRFSCTPLTLR